LEGAMRCGSSDVFSCKDWGTTLDGGGEKCLLQGCAPSGVKNDDAPTKLVCIAMRFY